MAWTIRYGEKARRALKTLDRQSARRITDYMDSRIAVSANPREQGKALTGAFAGLWRYRVGDHHVLCDILDGVVCVLVLEIGHRGDVYRHKR